MSEVMAVPKLRFKEFNSDWTFKNLSDVSNKPLYGMNSAATDFDGENKYLRITDIDEESHRFKFTKLSSPSDVIEEKYILKEGDLLFARTGASVGKSYIYDPDDGKVVFAGFLIKFGLKESVIPYFIFTQTLSEKFNNWVITNSMRSGQPGINAEEYSKWQIAFTSKPEQTKITSFLSAVDEKISQLTQKHALLSQYKQGIMQKLFSQQIRFKADDGSEFGEWASEKISKVFTNKSKSFNPLLNESLPCIELEHLSQNTGQILGTVNSSDQQSTKNLFEPNSVLYGKLRPYLRKFAKPQFKGVCSSEIWVLTGLKISNDYLFQFVQSEQFTELTNIQSGSKMPRADWNVIADAEIEFPCLGEQTKIANFLSSIDQKIEVVAQQIEQAKQWKKGLLQKMFI